MNRKELFLEATADERWRTLDEVVEDLDLAGVRGGFGSQMTDEPKSSADPDGLFAPMEGQDRAEGDFGEQALPRSPLSWLDTHPAWKWSIGGAGAALILSALRAKSGSVDEGF